MPRKARELSAIEVSRVTRPGMHAVGGVAGLLMQVSDTGARSWILRIWVGPNRRNIGLGGYPDVTLAQAREKAREMRLAVSEGRDPLAERQAARAALWADQARSLTFEKAVEKYLAAKLGEFRNEKHKKQWRSSLDAYALPALGPMAVDAIEVRDVLRALEPIWAVKTETASRLRGRIEAVLSWATVSGNRTGDNPARWKGNLDALLPKPSRVAKVRHHPALALVDAADWMADLRARDGIATRALEFVALTAARSGEVRGATWAEMDLASGLWTIPADKMKAGKEHRVPLTEEALALLKALPKTGNYVFPAARGGMLSDMALSACMRRIQKASGGRYTDAASGRPAVPHGLRSTFRDWAAERGFDRDMAEIALAHTVGSDVERAYRRGDMLERRRAMAQAWADFLAGRQNETVVQIHGAKT